MRVWLIGLGLIGPEFKLARVLLGRNLGGNSSWRYGVPEKAPAPAPQEEAPGEEAAIEETAEPAGDIPGEAPAEESEETANE